MDHADWTIQSSPFVIRRPAMTLIELLIVIVIIGILASAVLVAATSLIVKSKTRNTQAVLQIVADAVEQFKRTETEKPTITKHARYKARYGLYPPDELEVFTTAGVPGLATLPQTGNLAIPAGSAMATTLPPPYPAMRFYTDGTDKDSVEHRDLAALIVAIESQGGEAAALLEKISDRNRSAGALGPDKNPSQYLSRPTGINASSANATWGPEDLQIRYILDDWGIPIGYLAQRDYSTNPASVPSSNHVSWNQTSTEIVRLNGGQPVIFSYGPNGKEQLKPDAMGTTEGKATLMGDLHPNPPDPSNAPNAIDDPWNTDNVYSNDQIREKLAKVQ